MTGPVDDRCELAFHGGTLTLRGISRGAVTRLFGPSFWVADPRAGVWRCDAWRYAEVRTVLCESGWPFVDAVAAWEAVAWPNVAIPKLRPEQEAAVNAWRAARRGCIVMPTGTGKTETALAIMAEVQAATQRSIVPAFRGCDTDHRGASVLWLRHSYRRAAWRRPFLDAGPLGSFGPFSSYPLASRLRRIRKTPHGPSSHPPPGGKRKFSRRASCGRKNA